MDQKGEVQFQYQKAPDFIKPFLEAGIVPDIKSSGLCWLAATDMALSQYLADRDRRRELIKELGFMASEMNLLGRSGGINAASHLAELARRFKETTIRHGQNLDLAVIPRLDPESYQEELNSGRSLLFGLSYKPGHGHIILVDTLQTKDGLTLVSMWDPAEINAVKGHRLLPFNKIVSDLVTGRVILNGPTVSIGPAQERDLIIPTHSNAPRTSLIRDLLRRLKLR